MGGDVEGEEGIGIDAIASTAIYKGLIEEEGQIRVVNLD